MYGEENLGSRFMLVNENDDRKYILYCTSESCCSSGFNIVPSKVERIGFDSSWIIAESTSANREFSYWIIGKDFQVDLENCEATECNRVIMENVIGPLSHIDFIAKKESLQIGLDFNN